MFSRFSLTLLITLLSATITSRVWLEQIANFFVTIGLAEEVSLFY